MTREVAEDLVEHVVVGALTDAIETLECLLEDGSVQHPDDVKINKKRIKAMKRVINYYSVQDVYAEN